MGEKNCAQEAPLAIYPPLTTDFVKNLSSQRTMQRRAPQRARVLPISYKTVGQPSHKLKPMRPSYEVKPGSAMGRALQETIAPKRRVATPDLIPTSRDSMASSAVFTEVDLKLLDGYTLLAASEEDDPADSLEASLVGGNFEDVATEDLPLFTRLRFLDVSDNNLALSSFAALPELQHLVLSCNGISSLQCPANSFKTLKTLDLSHNMVSESAIANLVLLPALSSLNLSFNHLRALPSFGWERFPVLDILILSNNELTESCLEALSQVSTLRELYLDNNHLTGWNDALSLSHFPALELLSLPSNNIATVEALDGIESLKHLVSLILWGNPLVQPRRLKDTLGSGLLDGIAVQSEAPLYKKPNPLPSLDDLLFVNENILESDDVDYIEAAEEGEEEEDVPTDHGDEGGFFLTSVKQDRVPAVPRVISRGTFSGGSKRSDSVLSGTERSDLDRKLEEMYDPLMRLQPSRSSLRGGAGTSESVQRAMIELRYMLNHPAVYRSRHAVHHYEKTTNAMERRQEAVAKSRKKPLAPIPASKLGDEAEAAPSGDKKAQTLQDMETVLGSMKNRLKQVESNLSHVLKQSKSHNQKYYPESADMLLKIQKEFEELGIVNPTSGIDDQ
jgi:hypothetical protein